MTRDQKPRLQTKTPKSASRGSTLVGIFVGLILGALVAAGIALYPGARGAADAQAEANRRLALWSAPRSVFSLRGYAHLLGLELGQAVTLTAPRWGLNAGQLGQVVGLSRDWLAGRIDVEVLI